MNTTEHRICSWDPLCHHIPQWWKCIPYLTSTENQGISQITDSSNPGREDWKGNRWHHFCHTSAKEAWQRPRALPPFAQPLCSCRGRACRDAGGGRGELCACALAPPLPSLSSGQRSGQTCLSELREQGLAASVRTLTLGVFNGCWSQRGLVSPPTAYRHGRREPEGTGRSTGNLFFAGLGSSSLRSCTAEPRASRGNAP